MVEGAERLPGSHRQESGGGDRADDRRRVLPCSELRTQGRGGSTGLAVREVDARKDLQGDPGRTGEQRDREALDSVMLALRLWAAAMLLLLRPQWQSTAWHWLGFSPARITL